MNAEDVIDQILVEGLDDWVYSPVVIGMVKQATGLSGESLVCATMDVIRQLLSARLMEVGDTNPRFEPCSLTVPETLARIEREWRSLGVDSDFVAICWFANTPAGDERARQLRSG
jgi:hypothetical protein